MAFLMVISSFQESLTSTGQTSAQLPQLMHLSSITILGFDSIKRLKFPDLRSADFRVVLVIIPMFLCSTASFTNGFKRHIAHSSASFSGEKSLPTFTMAPPIVGCSSIRQVFIPCLASDSDALIPEIPPPITAALLVVFRSIGSRGCEYFTFLIDAFTSDIAFSVALSISGFTQEHCSRILAISSRYGLSGFT